MKGGKEKMTIRWGTKI